MFVKELFWRKNCLNKVKVRTKSSSGFTAQFHNFKLIFMFLTRDIKTVVQYYRIVHKE